MVLAPMGSYRWRFRLPTLGFTVWFSRLSAVEMMVWLTPVFVGRIECVYEPAMTKAFLHGRTEAIRSVQPESVEFIKVRHSSWISS
jgi:hypothetical protein